MSSGSSKPYHRRPQNLLNNVNRILTLPCDVPPSIWAVLGAEETVSAMISIAEPDFKEAYHKARGNALLHDFREGLEDTELIPPAEESRSTRFFFKTLAGYDIVVWDMFLASIAVKGLFHWTSQIYHTAECPNKGYPGQGHGNFFFGAINDNGNWQSMDFSFPEGTDYYPAHVASIDVEPGAGFCMAFHANFHLWLSDQPVGCSCRISIDDGDYVLDLDDLSDHQDPEDTKTMAFFKGKNTTKKTQRISCEWQWSGGDVPEGEVFPFADRCYGFMGVYGQEYFNSFFGPSLRPKPKPQPTSVNSASRTTKPR